MGMHNDNAIRKVAAKKFLAQRSQNVIACIAVMLTTFMVYTVCSLGLSFQQSLEMQARQRNGTSADMLLPSPTDGQLAELEVSGLCSHIGISTAVATLTGIKDTGISKAYLRYAQKICWEEQICPALTNVEGRYPEAENEVMMPRWAAQKLGLADPKVGQEVRLTFYYGYIFMRYNRLSDDMEKEFVISGLYDDPSSIMVRGDAPMYVSESFWDMAPAERDQYRNAAYITLKNRSDASKLSEMLVMEDESQELADLTPHTAEGAEGMIQVGAAVLIIILCGALIIYNILYISVAQDIQFLGKLKTLGMTRRQLRKYMGYQVRWLCMVGIPIGLALAALVSVFIVPLALKSVSSRLAQDGVSVSFSPILFAGAALVSAVTVFLGSRKPLRVAGSASPIFAARYVAAKGRKERKKERDSMLSIAWRNVFRSTKGAVVVFLSLFLAAVVFLAVDGLLSSVDASAMVAEKPYDLVVRDEYDSGLLTDEMVKQIAGMPGVEQVEIRRVSQAWLEAGGAAVRKYCEEALEQYSSLLPKEQLEEIKHEFIKGDRYSTSMIGIGEWEFRRISEKYGLDIDYDAFRSGKAGIWCYANSDISAGQEADTDSVAEFYPPSGLDGEKFTVGMAKRPVQTTEFGIIVQIAPALVMSNEMLQGVEGSCIWEVNILTESPSKDALVHDALKGMFQDAEGISIDSKQEKAERLDGSFATIRTIAASLSFILFAIGIMNFINTVYAGILARDRELAMLECIGMSKKQVRQMLVGEGLLYVAITGLLVATAGNAIYLGAFKVFSNITGWSQFHYPLRAAGITAVAMLLVAMAVPLLSYRSISGNHAMEQLRKSGR